MSSSKHSKEKKELVNARRKIKREEKYKSHKTVLAREFTAVLIIPLIQRPDTGTVDQ